MRRTLVPAIAGVMILSAAVYAGAVGSAPAEVVPQGATPERELQVMTYNVGHGRGLDGDVSLNRTAHRIRETGADVIALQEVDVHWGTRSDLRDQATELAELLDMFVYFAPIYSFDPGYDPERPGDPDGGIPAPPDAEQRAFGVAVLSSYPIVHAENHELTRSVGRGPDRGEVKPIPGLAEVTVNVEGAHVRVFSAHLQAGASELAAEIRATEVSEILEIVGENPARTLVLGDLNAAVEPDSPVYRPEILPLFAHLDDAWDQGEGAGYTFRASGPDRRIDYILVSPDVDVTGARVVDSDASDHLPVVADIELAR